ncbi:hypothetical protein EHI8A_222930 [Entamoeba histolytica HM-1:IMSS-B]|uniref:Uncharacterized protein n=3 Tax=Entamoeba TaxID=5758 RepID=M3TL45_ENTH1|nr:hypothetical protein EHI8A_222930 [Entamoeba histolytica HM-1:IMSS-B]ENY64744.1 unknown protein, putative [Entamoeba histolytica HM-1:IMSS-A]
MNRPSPLKRSKFFDLSVKEIDKNDSQEEECPYLQENNGMNSFLFSYKLNDYEVEMNTSQNIQSNETNDFTNTLMFEMTL